VEQIPANRLKVPTKIQRRLDVKRVEKMLEEFDLDAVGALTVSRRGGDLLVVDGQHRAEALRKSGNGSTPVQCIVYDGLTEQDEAKLFRLANNTKRLGPIDLFKARVIEGDTTACDIDKILKARGWRVGFGGDGGSFGAIAAFERIYQVDRSVAVNTINVLTAAFGMTPAGVNGAIITGVGNVIAHYGEQLNINSLATRLGRIDPVELRASAQTLSRSRVRRVSISSALSGLVVEEYNAKPRSESTRLPDWRY
jgi:hypothetical protein